MIYQTSGCGTAYLPACDFVLFPGVRVYKLLGCGIWRND